MLIACPQCSATYELPPERVPPGREVRCARCITLWTPVPLEPLVVAAAADPFPDVRAEQAPRSRPEPVPPPVFPAFTMPDPVEAPVFARQLPPRRGWALPTAWVLSIAVLAGLSWEAVDRRAELIQAWPPSERAFAALGLAPRH